METSYNLTSIKKYPHKYFNFYINLINKEESSDYFSPIFNLPRLPLLGSKTTNQEKKSSHNLGNILSLICFQIDICQGEEKNEIEQDFRDFVLPPNIEEYLNIDEVIEIDNNTDEPENSLFFMPKKKLNFYIVITELPKIDEIKNKENEIKINKDDKKVENETKDEIKGEIKNEIENEIKDEIKNEINMNDNVIAKQNEEDDMNEINYINDETKVNKFDDDYYDYNDDNNFCEKDFKLFNIIPHFFYINNNEKSLLEIKNMNFQRQLTLFNIFDKKYHDIYLEKDNWKEFIDINNLRAESSDILLLEDMKFIMRDNLKFYLNTKNDISQFYLIYTSYENEYHSVFYYITCNNDESKKKMVNILNESQTLKDIINKMENKFNNTQVISNLKRIFKNH